MITLSHFSISYGPRTLISNATVTIGSGRLTALTGRNGTGKSTLLRALAGLSGSYSGSVSIGGEDLRAMNPAALARLVAFVNTERVRVENLRCEDVVALGRAPYTNWIGKLREQDREIIHRSLEAVGMAEYGGRRLDTLSDGERQRVMIARALAQSTPVILLDEPTSFLDLPNRYELCRLLAKLAHDEGKCILYSTHELDIALQMSDDIAIIDTPRLMVVPVEEAIEGKILNEVFNLNTVMKRI